jgi:Tol biopolymer transport system component
VQGIDSTTEIELAHLDSGGVERVNVGDTPLTDQPGAASPPFRSVPVAADQGSDSGLAPGGQALTPAINADGRFVAFAFVPGRACGGAERCPSSREGRARISNIYLHDTQMNVTSVISRSNSRGDPNGASSWPAISDDGRFIAFVSAASNLVEGDKNSQDDVFVYDRITGTTELASRRPDGRSGNGASWHPAISGDGSTVAFQSLASDLVCGKRCPENRRDVNMLWDVFVLDRSTHTMLQASRDDDGVWMEPSHGPSLDYSGRVVSFSSRHPIDDQDTGNDDDLFIWLRGSRPFAGAPTSPVSSVSVDMPDSDRR